MKPVVVIIGRPNVGKSTLFNRLTRSRNAIVVDAPGVTRDRHYGEGRLGERPFLVVDTGGLEPDAKEGIYFEMAKQTEQAIAEADAVVWVLDARSGIVAADRTIAARLRKIDRRVWLAVNKSEGMDPDGAVAEFHELALGEPHPIAAAHGDGVRSLLEAVLEPFPQEREPVDSEDAGPRVAIVGRPNVGKSTLVNSLVGENRVIAFDQPGTTRDSIEVPFQVGERKYMLIDTAGLRRRGKQGEAEEHFSVIKALQSIEASNVAVLVLDAVAGVTDQDAHVAGFILERGRAVVVAVNKWDVADRDAREKVKQELAWKLVFLGYAPPLYISAKERKGMTELLAGIDRAYASAMAKLSTPKLTRALIAAVERQQPPRRGMGRPKMRYAHQGGMNPPRVVIHGNALEGVPETYRRYLEGYFRKQFALEGTPLAIEFRTGRNPYARRG